MSTGRDIERRILMKKILALVALLMFISLAVPWHSGSAIASDSPAKQAEDVLLSLPGTIEPGCWTRLEKIAYVRGQLSKLPPVQISCDPGLLGERDKKVLQKLIDAAHYMDRIFFRQVYSRNEDLLNALSNSTDPLDRLSLHYFMINFGPFDRLNDYRTFAGDTAHPPGANFYPIDMTRDEFEKWIKDHSGDKKSFTSELTVIRRKGGGLAAIPYSEEYKDLLEPAARDLREAADLTDNESLKKFLTLRAKAFLTNDYYESDLAWVDVKDSPIEVVIGPYEVYEDKLFNYKASFESFVVVNIPEDAKKFLEYTKYLRDMEGNLPLEDRYKNLEKEFSSPIRVVQEAYAAGDGRAGIHTSAFALPNDERVRSKRGCKKMMLKNIMAAKFKQSTYPIAMKILDPAQSSFVTFDSYFRDTVFHELSHALGPGLITTPEGTGKDVREYLRENYSAIEECKADTLSIYNQLFLMDKHVIPADDFKNLCASYLAGIFRSIRFGCEEAHGKGSLVQLNWMMEKGAFAYDEQKGVYRVDFEKFAGANRSLAHELLDIQARGDYKKSGEFLEKYTQQPVHLSKSLQKLYEIPVDIEPIYANK